MLEHEIAAIYYFIAETVDAEAYFQEIPQDLIVPCVFYPAPEQTGGVFSLSKYKTDFVMYIKFMARSTMKAYEMGNSVLQKLMKENRKIPLVNERGVKTGQKFQINNPVLKGIDNGVYQMEISWVRYSEYTKNSVNRAHEFFINGISAER